MTSAEAPYGELVDSTIRVMTWNVWGRFGPWEQRRAAIVRTLLDLAPDIVLLQECWFDDAGADQAADLAQVLGFDHSFGGGSLLFGNWGLGNAVLSRWPISGAAFHHLPALAPSDWGGIAQRVAIAGPRRPLLIHNVALDWPPHASEARQHALRALAGVITSDPLYGKAPLVVAGDFNAGPDSDEVRMLLGRGATAQPGFVLFDAWSSADDPASGATWSRRNPWAAPNLLPDQRIDHILLGWPRSGGAGSAVSARLAGTEPVDGMVPSDHYAVVADLRH